MAICSGSAASVHTNRASISLSTSERMLIMPVCPLFDVAVRLPDDATSYNLNQGIGNASCSLSVWPVAESTSTRRTRYPQSRAR